MMRPVHLLLLLLAACASTPAPLPPPDADVRPVVQGDRIEGRWTITAVNGRPVTGAWLELGAQGPPVVEKRADGGFNIGRPGPQTGANFGCNSFFNNGWTRNGDKLTLGAGGNTERGCDEPLMQIEEQAGSIIRRPMTMEFTPPSRLRLINEAGTLDLFRHQGAK
jgi:heat shock protein HslJ